MLLQPISFSVYICRKIVFRYISWDSQFFMAEFLPKTEERKYTP